MASVKAEKPMGSQVMFGQPKKEPAKVGVDGGAKAPAKKAAPKKAAEQKPREPKKKGKGGKPAAKN